MDTDEKQMILDLINFQEWLENRRFGSKDTYEDIAHYYLRSRDK